MITGQQLIDLGFNEYMSLPIVPHCLYPEPHLVNETPPLMYYQDMIDLGFKRIEESRDSVFFKQNGYEYFRVELKLDKCRYIDWCPETRKVTVITIDGPQEHNILNRWEIEDKYTLVNIINMFRKEKQKSALNMQYAA